MAVAPEPVLAVAEHEGGAACPCELRGCVAARSLDPEGALRTTPLGHFDPLGIDRRPQKAAVRERDSARRSSQGTKPLARY